MQETVQLPPMKSFVPFARAASMTPRFTGSSAITEVSAMRRVEAASIQMPSQPAARSFGYTACV